MSTQRIFPDAFPAITAAVSLKVAVGAAHAESAAIDATLLRLCATVACHVKVGAAPVAVADGTCVYLPAGSVTFLHANQNDKVSVIRDSVDGSLFVTAAL